MNVVYSASDLFSSLAGISLVSLFENNKEVYEINVYMVDNGISDVNKDKLHKAARDYDRKIDFVPFPEDVLKYNINIQKWNISTFGRLFEATLFPNLDKVIHIDCDTIVNGSLESLWQMDMGNAVVAGSIDWVSDEYKFNIGLNHEDSYVNAGFLLMNLSRIRELKLEGMFLNYIERNCNFLTYVDQEVLNACVPESEKIVLPLKYNSYSLLHHFSHSQIQILRNARGVISLVEYTEARDNAVVVHYTSCFLEGTRPWIEGDMHPCKDLFIKYKQISPWSDMLPWKDNRTAKMKLITKVARIVPRQILIYIVGYIHGVYVPKRNKKKQMRRN